MTPEQKNRLEELRHHLKSNAKLSQIEYNQLRNLEELERFQYAQNHKNQKRLLV